MTAKGLRRFLDPEQQRAWLEGGSASLSTGRTDLRDAEERPESLEQRFKYAARFEKLLRRAQAEDVLDILRLYGATCLPIPRRTERWFWSVSCLPSTSDKPLVRVNASWMELFTLLPDASTSSAPTPSPSLQGRGGQGLRARIILHLSDLTADGSPDPDQVDTDFLESCVERPEDVSHSVWRDGKEILIAKVRCAASIRQFLATPRALRAIRNFNLTHMNRGRNAYQASHCHSVADVMLGD
jgi:hypothetical protein